VDRTYVSQLERAIANPSVSILCRIAEILECELQDLVSDEPSFA
jgi:transcriptional regulator with XRE-family HTH domain